MRRAARRDDNQREVVTKLREYGATVQDLGALGAGCPDLLVGFRGQNYLLEVKDGRKKPSARELTADERAFHSTWKGRVTVVLDVLDALKAIGAIHA
jgi:hypothetical protein